MMVSLPAALSTRPKQRRRAETRRRIAIALLILVLIAGSGVMVGKRVLGSTGGSTFAVLVTSCHLTAHLHPLTVGAPTVIAGTSGTILFRCEENEAAFNVTNTGMATPHFSLPLGYTKLTTVKHSPNANTCSEGTRIVSDTAFTFRTRGGLDYCALYSNVPVSGLASFALTWSRQIPA